MSAEGPAAITWVVGRHASPDEEPAEWIPATVPGAVQLDWARHSSLGDVVVGERIRHLEGLEDSFWTYRTDLGPRHLARGSGERVFLESHGIDYAADVSVGGAPIASHRGMYQRWEVELGDEPVTISIRVHPAPKAPVSSIGGIWDWAATRRGLARHATKTAVGYGDDFHPPVPALGLWDTVSIEHRPAVFLDGLEVDYDLAPGGPAHLTATVAVDGDAAGLEVRGQLVDPDGRVVARGAAPIDGTSATLELTVDEPRLWWPVGLGDPCLHELTVSLHGADGEGHRLRRSVGFRRVELRAPSGAMDRVVAEEYPMTRTEPPTALHVNGVPVFAKAFNCVPPDVFPGRTDDGTYQRLVAMARQANANLLRVSGGGHVYKDAFFDECDRVGVMVWQDFPLACNEYPDDAAYLELLDAESRALVTRLREHPSLVVWCGGNELFTAWSGMTEQSLPLRLLNAVTLALDPHRPFLASTPNMGTGHGYYQFENPDDPALRTAGAYLQAADCSAYPEVGCPATPQPDELARFVPDDELFPPAAGGSWELHSAFFAHDRRPDTWLNAGTIERYFGPSDSLVDLCRRSQLLQHIALQQMVEEARRQAPRCGLVGVWCLNEPWPNAANLSVVSWYGTPKAGYHAVAAAFRPQLVVAELDAVVSADREEHGLRLWYLDERRPGDGDPVGPGDDVPVEVWWAAADFTVTAAGVSYQRHEERFLGSWHVRPSVGDGMVPGPELRFRPPVTTAGEIDLIEVRVPTRPDLASTYPLVRAPAETAEPVRSASSPAPPLRREDRS